MQKRATGRTTRMLQEASRLIDEGRAVYVIMDSKAAIDRVREFDDRIAFETPASSVTFDWEMMRLRGAHPNCVVLVDHYAIEQRYARLLEMLTRFDECEPVGETQKRGDEK